MTADAIRLTKSRRLDHRRMQAALYGPTTPPEVSIEIEDLEQELGLTTNEPTMTAPTTAAQLTEQAYLNGQHEAKIDNLNMSVVNLTQQVERLIVDIVPAMRDIAQTARATADVAHKTAERAMVFAMLALIGLALLAIVVL
jgi:outer membrane murein-binding lipoprotein Lpp